MQIHSFFFILWPNHTPALILLVENSSSWAFLISHTVAATPEVAFCCTSLTIQEKVLN